MMPCSGSFPKVSHRTWGRSGRPRPTRRPFATPRVVLHTPDLYIDAVRDSPLLITWNSYGNATNAPIRIDLYQDGTNGPAFLQTIAAGAADTGSYAWTPSNNNLGYGIYGLRIQVSIVGVAEAFDRSVETFTVPENTKTFYVNDASTAGDQYTKAAGSNRNTGRIASAPKPNPVNILRVYSIGPTDTLYIDTGIYPLIAPVVLSGTLGIGDDRGFVMTGPTNTGASAILTPALPGAATPLIEVNDASFMTIENLSLAGGSYGVWDFGGSTNFVGANLVATDQSIEAFRFESGTSVTSLSGLSSIGSAGDGIDVLGTIGSISGAVVENSSGAGILLSNPGPVSIVDTTVTDNARDGIDISSSDGLASVGSTNLAAGLGNVIENNGGDGVIASGNVLIAGNTIADNAGGTGIVVEGGTAEDNVVFGETTGIYTGTNSTSSVIGNRVYDNTGTGIDASEASLVQANDVYSNAAGIAAIGNQYGAFSGTVLNNLVYANAQDGIVLQAANGAQILNNTVYQLTGDALLVDGSSSSNSLRNNILWVQDGYDIEVASDSQTGFASDYNILYATGTGKIGLWQNVPRKTLSAWQSTDFTDENSIAQDPLFVDPAGPDGNLGYSSPTSDGRDDDFHEQSLYGSDHGGSLAPVLSATTGLPVAQAGTYVIDASQSPAIDRGAPTDSFGNEPAPNGGYVNIGAYGNTNQASKSPTAYLLVTKPNGGEVWPQGQTFPISWRSDQSTANALSFNGSSQYVAIPDSASLHSASLTVEGWFNFASTSGTQALITKAAGSSSNSSFALTYAGGYLTASIGGPSGNGTAISYRWTPAVGTWHEIAFSFDAATQNETLYVDGAAVASGNANAAIGYDAHAVLLGAQSQNGVLGNWFSGTIDEVRFWNSALSQSTIQANLNRTLTGSESGLVAYYNFDSVTNGTAADITGNGNTAVLGGGVAASVPGSVPSHAPLGDVNIELIGSGGTAVVEIIAASVPDDGEFLWAIPDSLAPGNYLVRVTRTDDPAFRARVIRRLPLLCRSTSTTSRLRTRAATPTGRQPQAMTPTQASTRPTPRHPSARCWPHTSLAPETSSASMPARMSLSTNIVLGSSASGYTIEGYNNPADPGLSTVLDRGNSNNGSFVFELDGATNVTLDHLQITGGYYGIHGDYGTASTGLIVSNSTIFGNVNTGADLESQNGSGNFDGAKFTDDTFYGVASDQQIGLLLNYVNGATISGNLAYNSPSEGIEVYGSRDKIDGNTVYDDGTGINVGNNSSDPGDLDTVSNNIVRENTSSGIYVNTNILVSGNFVYNNTNATGIVAYSATVSDNSVHDNATGILSYYASTITGNRVFHNSGTGIDAYRAPSIQGNSVYANNVGILGDTYSYGDYYGNFSGAITNNLVYDNASDGIILTEAGGASVLSNTVYQTTGDAVVLENSSQNISLLNNILWTQNGYDLNVHPDSEVGLSSDYNDLYFTAAGHIGLWEGLAFTAARRLVLRAGTRLRTASTSIPSSSIPRDPTACSVSATRRRAAPSSLTTAARPASPSTETGRLSTPAGTTANRPSATPPTAIAPTYSFTGLTPGSYEQVSITWPATPSASHTLLYVLDGDQVLSSFVVDQTQGPNGSSDRSSPWLNLGTYYVSGDTLKVEIVYENSYYNYNYTAVADAVSLQPLAGDVGADDNFHVQSGSPTIDAGDPASLSYNEPLPSGGRINLGFDGNTPLAATSPAQLIQVLAPNGLEKYVQGQQVNLQWQSDGLASLERVVDINTGNGPAIGDFQANMDQVDGNYYANGSFTNPVDVNGVDNPAPLAVYQSYVSAPAGAGNTIAYGLPVPDGTYTIRLDFADDSSSYEGQRVFDVALQGTTVQANYDIFQAAGDVADRATQLTFTVNASGGNGIALDLLNDTYDPAILSGIEITRTNPAGIANPTVDLAYSADGGSTWIAIASGVAMDRFGRGGYAWTVPANAAAGTNYLFRVTSDQVPAVQGTSAGPFTVANSGHLYYVNDGSTAGGVYTTAPGNNANDGKTKATPMASLGALLSAYVMHAGDIIYVDSGNYQVVRNIMLGQADSGITIEGPGAASVTLNRGNTNSGSYVFELDGATNVTISGLGVTGGYYGIHGDYGTASTGLTVGNSTIFGNVNTGADLESQNGGGNFDGARFTGDTFYGVAGDQSTGLYLNYVNGAIISGNVAYNSPSAGIEVYGSRDKIDGNTVYDDGTGINVGNNSSDPGDLDTVSNNIVRENTSSGIYVNTNILVSGNFVYNNTNATGIVAYSATVSDNSIHDNATGILSYYASTITGNRVFHNSGTGIDAYSAPSIQGNSVYANNVGILGDTYSYGQYYGNFSGAITNNLVYDNASDGISLTEAGGASVLSNTVYQTTGDAVVLENSAQNISLLNNILWTQNGYDLNVHPDSEVGLSSDYNDLYFTAAGHIGLWEGLAFTALDDWHYELGLDAHSLDVDPKFINPAGPDGLLGFSNQAKGSPIILDDSSPTDVTFTGSWATEYTGGYNGESAISDGTAGDTATYTFTGLTPNSYVQLDINWPATAGAVSTPFSIIDGGGLINTITVDQSQSPVDPDDPSSSWQSLGIFYVTGSTLQVQVAQNSTYYNVFYPAVADAVRLQPIKGDVGADDDFHVHASSPTIDAGDPVSLSYNEPLPNGGRINLGFDGNTALAASSPSQLIQVLSPNGLEKFVQGQQVNLQWQSDGLASLERIVDINTGNGPAIGDFQANMDQVDGNYYANGSFTNPVDVNGVDNPAPEAVYQSYVSAPGGAGNTIAYGLPVPDGTYTIRLDFADDSSYYEGQRVFDVDLQGTTVQGNYDIFEAAGDVADRATQLTFTVTASGGNGIALDLLNDTYDPAILSGIEITRTNPAGIANPTVNLAYSADGGSTWIAIASGVAMDRFGRGGYAWTVPANAATGTDFLFRVTSDQIAAVKGTSAEPFTVANSGHLYYVNDGTTSGGVYTTASGNNANDGKTKATPMASLGALLSAYVMHPGDIIYVDSGNYQVVRNIVLGPNDSGITIEGPGAASVTLNRGNTNSGSYVFELDGASNVTISGLGVTGGAYGLYGDYGSGSTGLTVSNSSFFANANTGADLEYSNDDATFLDDAFFGITATPQPNGLVLNNVNDSAVTGSVAHDSSNTGIYVNGLRDSIEGNQAHDDGTGISVSANSGGPADLTTVSDNIVRENSSNGIIASGDVLVTKNTVFDNVTGVGIEVINATATDNEVYGNVVGIYTGTSSSTITGNRVYNNSGSGIYAYLNTDVSGNYVYSNRVGIQTDYTEYGGGFSGTISDNLVYANVDGGIDLFDASVALVVNNTVYELVGDAVAVNGSSQNIRIENNILWVESGYDIDVAGDSQAGLASDYNLFNKGTDPNAHVGYYGGIQDTFAQWQAIGQDRALGRGRSELRRHRRGRQRPGLHHSQWRL